MKNKPLVSMITYCYNGERFISKYFDAILAQTYSNIELIFFNNGSEDKTGAIAEGYRNALEKKGILTNIIHYEDNQSTCMLKQQGFQMMKGEYFFGCDSDDFIDPTYVEEMVSYLENHQDKGIVYCQLRRVEEETGKVLSIMKMEPRYNSKEAFEDILLGTNINFTAISYMMSRKHFERINPKKEIYISRYGENYQVQMPFLYHDLQGYIEKPLGQYTVRKDSYTGKLDTNKKLVALKGQEETVVATLEQMSIPEQKKYELFFLKRIRRDRFNISMHNNDKELAKLCYRELQEVSDITVKERVKWFLYYIGVFQIVEKIVKTIKS